MEGSRWGGAVLLVDHLRGEVILVVELLKGGAAPMQVLDGLMSEQVVEVEDRLTIPLLIWDFKHLGTGILQAKEVPGHHCLAD